MADTTTTFLTKEDYKVVIGDGAYQVVTQADEALRQAAEERAKQRIAGYLRPKYDIEAIFSARTDSRSAEVIGWMCDIALYDMSASVSGRMGMEIRKERYEKVMELLQQIPKGNYVPDLPLAIDAAGETIGFPMKYGSEQQLNNYW